MKKEPFPIHSETSFHDASVRLQSDDGSFVSEWHQAIFRLVEVTMPGNFTAWLGVVDIAIEADDYMAAVRSVDPVSFNLCFKLSDDRIGLAKQLECRLLDVIDECSTCNVSFVGVTKLAIPRA